MAEGSTAWIVVGEAAIGALVGAAGLHAELRRPTKRRVNNDNCLRLRDWRIIVDLRKTSFGYVKVLLGDW